MVITDEEQEKIEERRPSYSSYLNKPNVIDGQMDISSFSTRTIPDIEPAYEEEDQPYEVEREYKVNGIQEDCTIIPTFMPTIEKKAQVIERTQNSNFKLKLNSRGKIIVAVFGIVATLLTSLCIYNAVLIGNIKDEIASKQVKLEAVADNVTTLETSFNDLNSAEIISSKSGFSEATEKITISTVERPVISKAETSSNWFDKVCKFLSNLFS